MNKLYFDENIPEQIAIALRLRGYDVLTTNEARKKGLSDIEQIEFARENKRIFFTFDIADFSKIHYDFINNGITHGGIIFSKQLPIGIIVKALLNLLMKIKKERMKNNIIWLSDWFD